MNVGELIEKLEQFDPDYLVIGIDAGKMHVRTIEVERAKGCKDDGKEFFVDAVHLFLKKDVALALVEHDDGKTGVMLLEKADTTH